MVQHLTRHPSARYPQKCSLWFTSHRKTMGEEQAYDQRGIVYTR